MNKPLSKNKKKEKKTQVDGSPFRSTIYCINYFKQICKSNELLTFTMSDNETRDDIHCLVYLRFFLSFY